MEEPRKVNSCFGKYGNTLCLSIFCKDYKNCKDCYWKFYLKKRAGTKIKLSEEIEKYLSLHNFELKKIRKFSSKKS